MASSNNAQPPSEQAPQMALTSSEQELLKSIDSKVDIISGVDVSHLSLEQQRQMILRQYQEGNREYLEMLRRIEGISGSSDNGSLAQSPPVPRTTMPGQQQPQGGNRNTNVGQLTQQNTIEINIQGGENAPEEMAQKLRQATLDTLYDVSNNVRQMSRD